MRFSSLHGAQNLVPSLNSSTYRGCAQAGADKEETGIVLLPSTARNTAPFRYGWRRSVVRPAQNRSRTETVEVPSRRGRAFRRKKGTSSSSASIALRNGDGG